ncbi:zinc-binding dehydrogenase, partial [Kitasatospora sp. NPDC006697]|uniref:zinc-binding dehydrogenase n=1 Tax=Kitasatospora sp. NPDC006697 TaxID=3364020 RepID=UPI0036D0677E
MPIELGGGVVGEWVVLGEGLGELGGRRFGGLGELAASGVGVGVVLWPVVGGVAEVVPVVQEWLGDGRWDGARLVVVTDGSVGSGGVWGLVRSVQVEEPGRVGLLELDGSVESLALVPGVLGLGESQVVVRGGEVLVPRLGRVEASELLPVPGGGGLWRVDSVSGGTLEGLGVVPVGARGVGVGEVRVEVRAAGVNFRDVLGALGMYPGEVVLGHEFAGVVAEVGEGVADLRVGDRVFGLGRGVFGPECVVDARLVARIPCGWSFVRAASVPVVFLTAFYGLVDVGGLRGGESVLVHAAAGGVGMAAVQVAGYLGARVFATASEAKWAVVRGLGVDAACIGSSRDLSFEGVIRGVSGGVDVVLNSLAGEFVDASARLLVEGGRFLEMGKTDVRPDGWAGPGVVYRPFDLLDAGPERIGVMLGELVGLFEAGVLRPLPVRVWDVRRVVEALRFMGQARHVGKVVLTVPR